ncbi:MAG TPA: hypothetical protein PK819_06110 [Thermomicrobiales bacterium]|nr:hypothetical protein [Thermomicrobiales bacterium]
MRIPQISVPSLTLSKEQAPKIAIAAGAALVVLVGLMSVVPAVHNRFNWVPISNDQIVIDSVLKLIVGLVLTLVAVFITLPVAMAIHTIGHAVGGTLFHMRLLAVRLGPVLFTPLSVSNRFERIPIASRRDLLTGWAQFDDSPLPTWQRLRGWQATIAGGPALNLLVGFLAAMASFFAAGYSYVFLRQILWLNIGMCIATLIPWVWERFSYTSDGKLLMALVLDADDGADDLMETLRNEVVVGPLRPASWPRERESAWELKLRSLPATDEGRSEQMETLVYLFLHATDRGEKDTAWRWVQAMHHLIAQDANSGDIAIDTGRIMCALYAARWEKNPISARNLLDSVSPVAGLRNSPWYAAANAATLTAAAMLPTAEQPESLVDAKSTADLAAEQLHVPAKLHGVDQMLLGITEAVLHELGIALEQHALRQPASQRTPASATAAAQAFGQSAA